MVYSSIFFWQTLCLLVAWVDGIMDCLKAKEKCQLTNANICGSLLEYSFRSCKNPSGTKCKSGSIKHCQKSLKALHHQPFFSPACTCDTYSLINRSDQDLSVIKTYGLACRDLRNFIYNHPCLYKIPRKKQIKGSVSPLMPITSCTLAHEICFASTQCKELFNRFQKHCKFKNHNICTSLNSYDCWQTWLFIRETSLFNCSCPVYQDTKCPKIQNLVQHNPCIKKLEAILAPTSTPMLEIEIKHRGDYYGNTTKPVFAEPALQNFKRTLLKYMYANPGGLIGNMLGPNLSYSITTLPSNDDISSDPLLDQLRLQEDFIWMAYLAQYLYKTPPPGIAPSWSTSNFSAPSLAQESLGATSSPLVFNQTIQNQSIPLRVISLNDLLTVDNNDSNSVVNVTLEMPYDNKTLLEVETNVNDTNGRHRKRATNDAGSTLSTISLFDKLQNLTLSTPPVSFNSSGHCGPNATCWYSEVSYRNPIYLRTTPMSIEDLKCTAAFARCNKDSKCFHAMSDMLSACTFSHKELDEDLNGDGNNEEKEKIEESKENPKNAKKENRIKRKVKGKIEKTDKNVTEEPMVNDAEAKLISKKTKKKTKSTTKKTDTSKEDVSKKGEAQTSLVCDRVVCMGAVRNFYQQVDPYYTHPLVFCTCDPSDNACLRVREAIAPPCASHPQATIKLEGADPKTADSSGVKEDAGDADVPSCLEIRRLCQFDFFCNDHMENYRKNCKMSSDDGKCREELPKCREARIGLMGTEFMVHNCTCETVTETQDESIKSNCLDIYQMLFENTCLEEAALDYVSNPISGPRSTTIATTTTLSTTTTPSTTAIAVSRPGPAGSDRLKPETTLPTQTTTLASIGDKDCTAVHTACIADPDCGPKMEEMLSVCSTSGSCDPGSCKEITSLFYHTVDPYYTYAAAFCQCTPKDKTCFGLKEVFESRCVMISSLKTSCIQIYDKCSNNTWCNALLQELETNCQVVSIPTSGSPCVNGDFACRDTLIKIKGSELMLKKCLCEQPAPQARAKCMDYFKIMVNNSCIDYSIKMYNQNPIKKLKSYDLPQFSVPTTQTSTIRYTKIEQEKIPLNCSARIHPDDDPIYIPTGSKVRVYAQKRDCSRLCTCLKENELDCIIIPCLPTTPCIRKFAIYGHGAPTYVAFRGYCLCFMGKIICVKPDPEKFSFTDNDKGLYISIGYSSQEFSLLERVTQDDFDDLIPRMQNVLTTDRGTKFNKTRCALDIFFKYSDNVVIEAKLAMQNDSRGLKYRDKECIRAMQALSSQINNHGISVASDPLLSVLKLSEVFMRLPEDDVAAAISTLGLGRGTVWIVLRIVALNALFRAITPLIPS